MLQHLDLPTVKQPTVLSQQHGNKQEECHQFTSFLSHSGVSCDRVAALQFLKGAYRKKWARLFSKACSDRAGRGEGVCMSSSRVAKEKKSLL